MATALDVITTAMRLNAILPAGSAPTADEGSDCLVLLNDMIAQWEALNVYTGISALALTDTVPIEAKHLEAVKAMLAMRIAPLFGVDTPVQVKKSAMTGWELLKGDYFDNEQLRSDDGISYMPSQRRYW